MSEIDDYEDNIEGNHLDEHSDGILAEEDDDLLSELAPSSPPSPPSNNESINQLTLQLLLNTNSYKKYMAKVQSEKKDAKPPIEDLDLYLGNIEQFISSSLEKVLHTGELRVEPLDPTFDMCESFRSFLSKSIEYYRNLANIKVKKIDCEEKNYDQMGTCEKEHISFLKVKKSGGDKKLLNDDYHGLFPQTTPAGTFMIPPPPSLKRHTAKTWKTYNYNGGFSESSNYDV